MSHTLTAPVLGDAPLLTQEDLDALLGTSDTTGAPLPTMQPPGESSASAEEDSAAATITGQLITALFSDAANRNVWLAINGVGWRKVSQTSDTGATSIAMIGALAKAMGRAPVMNDDASGLVQDIVLW